MNFGHWTLLAFPLFYIRICMTRFYGLVGLVLMNFKIAINSRKIFEHTLKLFSSDNPRSMNIRNRPKQLAKGEFIIQCGMKCTNRKEKLNWHCVLNTNQLVGYTGKTIRIIRRAKLRKRTLSVYTEPAFWFFWF